MAVLAQMMVTGAAGGRQPFDAWLAADLHHRFDGAEHVPEEWLALIDRVELPEG